MTTLTAAPATAIVIIEPENLSRMMISFCPAVSCCNGIPHETQISAYGSFFWHSPIARSCRQFRIELLYIVQSSGSLVLDQEMPLMMRGCGKASRQPVLLRGSRALRHYMSAHLISLGAKTATAAFHEVWGHLPRWPVAGVAYRMAPPRPTA